MLLVHKILDKGSKLIMNVAEVNASLLNTHDINLATKLQLLGCSGVVYLCKYLRHLNSKRVLTKPVLIMLGICLWTEGTELFTITS